MATKKISIEDFRSDSELNAHVTLGREVARALDSKASFPVALTHPEFVAFITELTPSRFELLRQAVKKPRSISELADALHREQSAVSKDVARLQKLGLVRVEEITNAGHGRKKLVVPVADSISISTNLAAA